MRLFVNLDGGGVKYAILPLHYNYMVQGMIYKSISRELAEFLHEKGFMFSGRSFKLFTFSRIIGKMRRKGDKAVFKLPVKLGISSSVERFIRELGNTLIHRGEVSLGDVRLRISGIEIPKPPEFERRMRVRMLSPVTVYSTLYTAEGCKKTYYYSPMEKEFSEIIEKNARKKYKLINGTELDGGGLKVKPLRGVREVIVVYKGFIVKGWMGVFLLEGDERLIEAVYNVGLGSKNPQGFGMFEVV